MKSTAQFIKFFPSTLKILAQNQFNLKYYYNKSIQKIEKELKNKKTLLAEKKNRFRQANNEFENCPKCFEILKDFLLKTKEKQKTNRFINQIKTFINRRPSLSRKMKCLLWKINYLTNLIEKRQIQYLQLRLDQYKHYVEKNVFQQQLKTLLLQPVTTGF